MDGVAKLPSVARVHGVAPDACLTVGVTAVVVVTETGTRVVLVGAAVLVGCL